MSETRLRAAEADPGNPWQANADAMERVRAAADVGSRVTRAGIPPAEVRGLVRTPSAARTPEATRPPVQEVPVARTPDTRAVPGRTASAGRAAERPETRSEAVVGREVVAGVTVERTGRTVTTSDAVGRRYVWPNTGWGADRYAALHAERVTLPAGRLAAGVGTVDGLSVEVRVAGDGVETRSPDGRVVRWLRADLDATGYARLHSLVSRFDTPAPTPGAAPGGERERAPAGTAHGPHEAPPEPGRLPARIVALLRAVGALLRAIAGRLTGHPPAGAAERTGVVAPADGGRVAGWRRTMLDTYYDWMLDAPTRLELDRAVLAQRAMGGDREATRGLLIDRGPGVTLLVGMARRVAPAATDRYVRGRVRREYDVTVEAAARRNGVSREDVEYLIARHRGGGR